MYRTIRLLIRKECMAKMFAIRYGDVLTSPAAATAAGLRQYSSVNKLDTSGTYQEASAMRTKTFIRM